MDNNIKEANFITPEVRVISYTEYIEELELKVKTLEEKYEALNRQVLSIIIGWFIYMITSLSILAFN